MPKIKIRHPSGKTLVIDSPDDSIPSEEIIDQMFKQSGLDIGEIKNPPNFSQELGTRLKRYGAGITQALVGDIPFIRKTLPQSIQQYKPIYPSEQFAFGATRLGRDIGALKGVRNLGLLRTALRGAGIGLATAGTEKPEDILSAGAKGAIALPAIKGATEKVIVPLFQNAARKGLKTTQQMWQDFIRAGFTVEKSSVERVQQKGLHNIFTKNINPLIGVSNRDNSAYLKLAEKIHNSALDIRKYWGDKVGRWRNFLFKDPKIKVDISKAKDTFQKELSELGSETLSIYDPKAVEALSQVNNLLNFEKGNLSPRTVYSLIDKLEDMISASKRGLITFGKNEGRILGNLMRDLKQHIYNAAPRNIKQGLQATEAKFANVAEITDDIFDKLQFAKQGVAQSERIGAAEQALQRGLKIDTPVQEKMVWERLNNILPPDKKFMELYKDIFAAQDLQREGIGWLFRRMALSPRMAAFGLQITQPIMKGTGIGLKSAGELSRRLAKPIVLRKIIQQNNQE
jgi:hypothetical protein